MSDYLNYLIGSASEHRTIGCHMSAISAYYEYIEKKPVCQRPYVCALLKEVLNQTRTTTNICLYLGHSTCFRVYKNTNSQEAQNY